MASRLGYAAVFAAPAVESFLKLPRRRQRKLLDRAHELAGDPFLLPDFRSTDSTGKAIAHLLVDGFIFDFWVDHAAKQVVVIAIGDVS